MDIQTIILGFLMEKSMTGYDLKQWFSRSFIFFSGISYGSIYPALKKMEKEGLITAKVEIQESAPNKKLCTITDKGRERFRQSLRSPLPEDKYKNAFLSRLFFFAHMAQGERGEMFQEYLDQLSRTQAALLEHRPIIEENADPFQLACFECGVRFVEDLQKNILEKAPIIENIQDESVSKGK